MRNEAECAGHARDVKNGFVDALVLHRELSANPIATSNEKGVVMRQVDMDTRA